MNEWEGGAEHWEPRRARGALRTFPRSGLSSLTQSTPRRLRLLFVLEAEKHAWGRVPGPSPWGLAGKGHSQDSFPPEGHRHQTGCQGLTFHSPPASRSRARGEMGTASAGPAPGSQPALTPGDGGRVGAGAAVRLEGPLRAVSLSFKLKHVQNPSQS